MLKFGHFSFLALISAILVSVSHCDHFDEKFYYKEKFIDVPLDHFNYVTNTTFKLRYLINDTFTGKNNQTPILFYTGNEGDVELFAQNTGAIWELAPSLNALVIFAEHRYYGKSLPFGNVSFAGPEHHGYLTIEQALADYAQLLDEITGGKNDRPVIAIGGSYGGMLAAWFRMKYPHHVAGALAASAPIWQFPGLTPCSVYTKIVTAVFRTAYNENCSDNIQRSWNAFKNYSSSDSGRAYLNTKFNICKDKQFKKPDDINAFFDYLEDVYGNLAMANYPYDNDFLAPLPAYPVRQFCLYLKDKHNDKDLIDAMQSAISVYSNFTGQTKCLDYQSAYDPSLGGSAWEIQTCNEIVMPMCSGGQNDMFMKKDWNLKEYSDKCFNKFKIRPRSNEILIRFGGASINFASNIIFSNGLLDPWSGGGVLRSTNNDITVIIIPEGAHHIDLRSSHPKDPSSVRAARKMEKQIIESWIRKFFAQ